MNGKSGQISIGTIFGAIGVFGAAIYFVWGQFDKVGEINTTQTKDIGIIQEQIKPLTEMRDKIEDMDRNILLLMQAQKIKPFERITSMATTTQKYDGQ